MVFTVLLWGGNAVANQFVMDALPPVFVGGARFALASVFMLLWCRIEGSPLWITDKAGWQCASILGFLNFAQIATFCVGIAYSNTSHTTLLVNSYVFWVAFYEVWILRTVQFRWWQTFGLLVAGFGCLLLVLESSSNSSSSLDEVTLFGDIVLACSGLILAIKVIYTKHAVRFAPTGTLILWHDIIGSLLLFIWAFACEDIKPVMPPASAWFGLFYVGVLVSGFCFASNAWLLKRHGASQVSVFSFGTPICGVILGVLLRGDQLSSVLIAAGTCVVGGIFLTNLTLRKKI